MDDLTRIYLSSALGHSARSRRSKFGDSEVALPTLAHVPGVEVKGRYITREFRREARAKAHAAVKRPRKIFAYQPREKLMVHLGGGKVMFE